MKALLKSAVTWKVPNEITLDLQVVHVFLESLDKTPNHIEKDKYGLEPKTNKLPLFILQIFIKSTNSFFYVFSCPPEVTLLVVRG